MKALTAYRISNILIIMSKIELLEKLSIVMALCLNAQDILQPLTSSMQDKKAVNMPHINFLAE